ncbi:hypothetical protein BH23PSE1_BH23PSE1_11980 [soil metagenome]
MSCLPRKSSSTDTIPVGYVEALDRLVAPGGVVFSNVKQHQKGLMHVSPNLSVARARLIALGYQELVPECVFAKPAHGAGQEGTSSAALT